jgi:hypothetical protein
LTFLSKLGKFLAEGIALATGVWPLVSQFFGSKASASVISVENDLTQIGAIIVQVEAVIQTPGSGTSKLAVAVPLVANIIKTSELVSGHKIVNEALFIQGCTDITNGVAEILNSLDPGAVQSTGKPTTPVPAPTQTPAPNAKPAAPAPTAKVAK